MFLVQQSGHVRNRASVITAGFTMVFPVLLSVPHVLTIVGVEGEHVVVLGGLGAFECKIIAK